MRALLAFQFAALTLSAQVVTSVFPLTVQRGQTYSAVIRGTKLDTAQALYFGDSRIEGRVIRIEDDPAAAVLSKVKPQALHAEIKVGSNIDPGSYRFRVITREGLSDEMTLRIADHPILEEPAEPLRIPAIVTGRIATSGELDHYWIDVRAGQTLSIQASSGSSTLDPVVGLYEPSGSWFNSKRLNRIAFNDEPLNFPGLSRDAKLTYTFPKAGRYCVRVEGFNGQGGPDSVYELRISEGSKESKPHLRPTLPAAWEERALTRSISPDWMQRLANRGAAQTVPAPETYHGVPEGSTDIPVMKMPGIVEGVIARPGETHVIRINVEKAQETVIEVETPEATTPLFTPVIRLLEPGGQELVGNLYTRLNNNNLKMMKAIMAKTTFSLIAPGTYTLQIHELTTDHAGPDYRYRVMVRSQIPHVGKFIVQQERISLERGGTRPITVRMEREEGYTGMVAVQVENLPAGVSSFTGIENPDDRPTLPNAGKLERYQPRVQLASVVLTADPAAPAPAVLALVRVVARPVREGRLGEPIASADIPLLIVEKQVEKK